MLGMGDSSLPLAGLSSVGDVYSDFKGLATGESTYLDLLNSALELGAEFLPGGSQLKRTAQGIETFAKGGKYNSKGNPEYVVGDDVWTAMRMALFGKYSTPEAQAYYAAKDAGLPGGKALTDTQARNYELFRDAMQATKLLTELLGGESKQSDVEAAIRKMGLPNNLAAAIWQSFNKGWSPKNNPFNTSIGQQIWDELNGGN